MQQFLAAGSQDKSVSVWPQGESKPLLVLRRAFKASVSDLAWTPDGLTLLAASLDGTVACICFTPAELGTALSQAKVCLLMHLLIFRILRHVSPQDGGADSICFVGYTFLDAAALHGSSMCSSLF